ncbi:MAG: hypothetical protein K1X36_07205 [Pyrinomonadaceae bacterium]|nr:hypothetical protein [Pyrinomonadaceae bacterium]
MNFFEDLVVELKEENLLESTVMDNGPDVSDPAATPAVTSGPAEFDVPEEYAAERESDVLEDDVLTESSGRKGSFGLSNIEPPAPPRPEPPAAESADIQLQGNSETVEIRKPSSEREFFIKRATSEISSLQMVEAVLSAVERERMKIVPRSYDDLEAKKALHVFLQMAGDVETERHKQAEFDLLRETEAWCSALAKRDREISVTNIRRYCENCKPMLSSQAMLALARFYRNLPYSESVRGKFDFIITRLFSRPTDDDLRLLLFTRDEMFGHIKTLYAEWSSIPLYSADGEESSIALTSLSFEDLAKEAEAAVNFDDLIRSDFFGRLRLFKESIAELFFAPSVTAAAIECNVRIGNKYVELIDRERRKTDAATVHDRFGEIDDQVVSEAAGRTLELVNLLRERVASDDDSDLDEVIHEEVVVTEVRHDHQAEESSEVEIGAKQVSGAIGRAIDAVRSVNRWFLLASVIMIIASVGVFVWGNYFAEPKVSSTGVKTLSFQGTDLADVVKTAKLSGDTLYVVAQTNLDQMSKEKQTEVLQKLYQAGNEKGWTVVNLMNSEGKTVGYVTPNKVEIISAESK